MPLAAASSSLDGAMGTMIQRRDARRGRLPGHALRQPRPRSQGQQRRPGAHPARRHRESSTTPTSPPAPTSSRPTPSARTRIAQADYGLEDAVYDLNVAGAQAGAQGGRRLEREARPTGRASWPGRSARPTRRCRCRPTSTTPASAPSPSTRSARRLRRAGARPDRRRRRPAAGRDLHRHPQPQGRAGRHRGGVRRAGTAACR